MEMIYFNDLPITYDVESRRPFSHVVARYDNGAPVDRFEVWFSLPDGWMGWTRNTIAENVLKLRKDILKNMNSKKIIAELSTDLLPENHV